MTKKLNLMLHCGAKAVERQQVLEVRTPDGTDTWQPIPHRSMIDMLEQRLPDYGMEIVAEAHGLSHNTKQGQIGDRYFGMFQVAPIKGTDGYSESDDYSLIFGARNAHDKAYSAGLCLGNGVFVCDNLSFSAEIVIGRKHTVNIMRDLPNLVNKAVGRLMDARVDLERRIETYKQTELSRQQANDIIVRAMEAGAITSTRIPHVVKEWKEPKHDDFKPRTMWSLFNSFTEDMKNVSVLQLPQRTTRLHGLLDSDCGLVLNAKQALIEDTANMEDVTVS